MPDRQGADRLRAGVIGLGWAGQQHMIGYLAAPDTDLVALAGMETDLLASLGEAHGVDLRYTDWREMIDQTDLDVVSICTPTSLHAPMALAALEAGVHVLSEKPMAQNADVAATMVGAAEANDRVLEVSFNHRRRGSVAALRALVDAGVLGSLYYVKAGWLRRTGIPGLGSWFTRAATSGGGPLMDIGVHMLDMALYLLDEPTVTTASAATYAQFGPVGRGSSQTATGKWNPDGTTAFDVEDLATAFLRLSGGATLLLESSWAAWIAADDMYLDVYGADGGAHISFGGPGVADVLKVWTEVAGTPADLHPLLPPNGGHAACVADFVAHVRSGDFAAHRGQQALKRAQVVDACYISAAKGAEVSV